MYYRLITHVIAGRVIVQPGRRQGDSCPHRKGPHDTALIVFTINRKTLTRCIQKTKWQDQWTGAVTCGPEAWRRNNSTTEAGFAVFFISHNHWHPGDAISLVSTTRNKALLSGWRYSNVDHR